MLLMARCKGLLLKHYDSFQRLLPNRHLPMRTAGGWTYLNLRESSMMFARAVGLYEVKKTAAVQEVLRPGGTFVDVGGNKGDFALLAARAVGPSGKVICVEPAPENCRWIARSIQRNKYQNIHLYEMALSDRDGDASLYLGAKSGFHSLLEGRPNRECGVLKVKTRALDSLLEELGSPEVDAIKIDVEGAEEQVLRGAWQTLRRNPRCTVLVDLHPFLGVDPTEALAVLKSLGFAVRPLESGDSDDIIARGPMAQTSPALSGD